MDRTRITARRGRLAASWIFAALLLGGAVSTQSGVLPAHVRAAADRIVAEDIARDLAYLASDDLRGRNTPSPGFDTAAKHIADRLGRAGLRPAGDAGTFFQHYEMRELAADTDAARVTAGDRELRFGDDFLYRSFAGPVDGTFEAVYVGHGWVVPGRGIDPYRGVNVRGKVVIAHGPRALPKGVEIRQIGRLSAGASPVLAEAARRGAAAVLFLPQESALKGWEQARGQNIRRREMDPSVPSAYAAVGVTSLLLSRDGAAAVFAGERLDGAAILSRGEAADYPEPFALTRRLTLRLPAASDVRHRPYNVVAILEGRDPALRNEYITVAAHLDGAVGTRTVDGDAIYNSADDNASGSAGVLAIAEQMAKVPPRRSVIFIWDSGEEQGLWGTRHFLANPPVPRDRIVAHFNIDMIGANRAPGSADASEKRVTETGEVFVIGPGVLSPRADALLEAVNAAYLKMRYDRAYDRPDHEFFYPRTDAGPYLERGILTIGFTTGIHDRYHLPADEARFLDPKKIETISRTVFASIWALGETDDRPRIENPIPPIVLRPEGGERTP